MKKYILSLIVIVSLSSCFKERIELDLNTGENKKVVVLAWITTLDEPQFVDLSYTLNYLGKAEPEKISGASVVLSDETQNYTLLEKPSEEKGKYFLPDNWTANVGDNYKLKINFEGEEYTSEHQMRPCPDLVNIYSAVIEEELEGFEEDVYETFISFLENPGTGDAYYAVDYKKGGLQGDTLFNGGYDDDQFIDGLFFEDIGLTDYDRPHLLGDTVVIDFYSIGLETANFLQDIESEIFRGSPFDPPPTNVRTNITGGAVGYFIVSDARREELVIE